MKLTISFFFLTIIQVHALVYSQNSGFTMSESGVSIKEVLKELENSSSYRFFYSENWLYLNNEVDISVNNVQIENVLEDLFENSTLTYKVFDNELVVIVPKFDGSEQDFVIKGKVTDSEGYPLPGVNIVEKGTTAGGVTDLDGNYTISVSSGDAILLFSYVGFLSEEIEVGGQTTIDVTMIEDIQSLEEVVVIGYGTQKRSDLTGAVSTVKAEDIQKVSARRIDEALQGRAAGVMITKAEGNPGSGTTIHVRGAGSLSGTEPLWIIDGMRVAPGNHLNMADVESIEILKDAAASAIYGAQAAHGVILVTTKRGSNSKPKVTFRSSVGQHKPINIPEMLNTEQFLEMNIEARQNAGTDYSDFEYDPSTLPNTNWAEEVYGGNGIEQDYNLSVTGGNENAKYFLSTSYDRENGIMIDNWFERYSIRANSDFNIGKRIKIGESLAISKTRENPTAISNRDLERIFRAIPTMPVYDETNPYGGWGQAPGYFQGPNPVAAERQNHQLNTVNRIVGNLYASVEILDGLSVKGTVGGLISSGRTEIFNEAYNYGSLSNTLNALQYISDDDDNLSANVVATYDNSFGSHNLQVMAGYEGRKTRSWQFGAKIQDFPVSYTNSMALATGSEQATNKSNIGQSTLLSQFGRLSYNYEGRYLLQANIRRDGSSKFGSENRWGVFPSASVGWRISDETFMQSIPLISNLKLRASWGINGSDNIAAYLYSSTYWNSKSMYVFDQGGEAGRERGFYLRRFPNAQAKWEEIEQTDIGFDMGLIDNKLSLTADYYIKNTKDMLYSVALPSTFGVSQMNAYPESPKINLGTLENKGLEIAINYSEKVGDLTINIGGNTAFNKNKIKSLNKPDDIINAGSGGTAIQGTTSRSEVGEPMGYFYGYIVEGIFQNQSEVDAANAGASDGVYWRSGTAPGDFKFKDIASEDENGNIVMVPDGEITNADRTKIGNPWPKMIYGININLEYKGIDFTMFFQGVKGVELFNANKAYYRTIFQDYNTSTRVYDRWTSEGSTNEHPRLISSDPNGNFRIPSSYFVEDGSYLKLRNLQVGYTLPTEFTSKLNIVNLRFYVNAQNLFTITKYEGMDPELAGGNTSRGIDGQAQYPHHRLLSAGIEVSF